MVRKTIEMSDANPAGSDAFYRAQYARLYGHHQPGGIIEITKLCVVGSGLLPQVAESILKTVPGEPRPYAHRRVFLGRQDGWAMTAIYHGDALRPGHELKGPLIVEEETTTLFVGGDDTLTVDAAGNFVVELGE